MLVLLAMFVGSRAEPPRGDPALPATGTPPPVGTPLMGANLTHWSFPGCSFADAAIVTTYDLPGVRRKVRRHLRAMRLGGVETLRLVLWHMGDARGQRWGVISAPDGRLREPVRGNLARYASDVREAGFVRLTVVFAPQWTERPLHPDHEPAAFETNWRFITEVREVMKRHGPGEVRVDLLSEGAPSNHQDPEIVARASSYLTRMYGRYAGRFGTHDVVVSVIGEEGAGHGRLQNLIDALEASGHPLPEWFDIHTNFGGRAAGRALFAADSVLESNGLDQPLVVGETRYDDEVAARAMQRFRSASRRPVEEVAVWYRPAGAECNLSPPYSVDPYRRVLRGEEAVGP